MEFLDDYDEMLAKVGPPAIFTLNYEGCLQFDLLRSRDITRQNPNPQKKEWCHCVYVDKATGWPQYILSTSPDLCRSHQRATIVRCSSYEDAIAYMNESKRILYEKASSC